MFQNRFENVDQRDEKLKFYQFIEYYACFVSLKLAD